MAQIKLLKTDTDGVPVGHNSAADDLTFLSYTVTGGGPVLSGTGLDLNNQDVSDIKNITFNTSSTATIGVNGTTYIADDWMFQTKENVMSTAGAVLFPVITDNTNQVDAFRLPALAGAPTASPADGGEGYLVWDSTGDRMFAWNGTSWDDLSTVTSAASIINGYIADEALTANDLVYISAADNVSKCDPSTAGAASRAIGFATATVADTDPVFVQSEGVLTGFAGLTAGARYYADPAVPGGITATLPVGSGNTIVQAGYAKSATALHIHIEQMGRRA